MEVKQTLGAVLEPCQILKLLHDESLTMGIFPSAWKPEIITGYKLQL